MRSIGDPQLSPDGHSVVVVIADSTADGGKKHLWLVGTDGEAPRQLTYSPESDKAGERAPMWMPDGSSVLFLAHRGEHTALFRLPMRGGEAKAFDIKVQPLADTSKRFDAIPLDAIKQEEQKAATESSAAQGSDSNETKPIETSAEPVPADVDGYSIAPDGKLSRS